MPSTVFPLDPAFHFASLLFMSMLVYVKLLNFIAMEKKKLLPKKTFDYPSTYFKGVIGFAQK